VKDFQDHYSDVIAENRIGNHPIEWDEVEEIVEINYILECKGDSKEIVFKITQKDHGPWSCCYAIKEHPRKVYLFHAKYPIYNTIQDYYGRDQSYKIEEVKVFLQQWYLKWLAEERCK